MGILDSIKNFILKNFKINISDTNESIENEYKCSFVKLAKVKG